MTGLTALGKPVAGLIGAWGHKYPFNGYPGPRVDWLNYILVYWWDRWLKGKTSPPEGQWPQLPVWLGASKEPSKSTCDDETGKWVAEDGFWQQRVKERVLYLRPNKRLGKKPAPAYAQESASRCSTPICSRRARGANAAMTTSPAIRRASNKQSLYFDSDPLREDFDVFGAPVVTLTLSADRPVAALAVRLNEVSPKTGASHLVCYRFCNLADRGGDLASPERVEAGEAFHLSRDPQHDGPQLQEGLAHQARALALLLSDAVGISRSSSPSRCIWERTGG